MGKFVDPVIYEAKRAKGPEIPERKVDCIKRSSMTIDIKGSRK